MPPNWRRDVGAAELLPPLIRRAGSLASEWCGCRGGGGGLARSRRRSPRGFPAARFVAAFCSN